MIRLLNLSLKTFALMAIAFFLGTFIANACDVPEVASLCGLVASLCCLIPNAKTAGVLATITAADVITEWKAVYRAEGQGIKDIVTKLMQKSITASYFPTRITEKTIMEKVSADFTRVMQAFQKAFTPIGGTTFKPLQIPLQKIKIDISETPDDLEESWLGFLAGDSINRKDWPFIKWYLTNILIQADKDLELTEIYKGVPAAIVAGTASASGASILGIRKQINTFNTAGKTTKIVMGAVPTDPLLYVEYIETMVKSTSRLLRNELDFIFVQEDGHDLFRDGMRLKYNAQYSQVDDTKITKLRNDNIQVVGLPSMAGSGKVWTTPLWNRQAGTKKPANQAIFEISSATPRVVNAYTDYYKGFGFWVPEYIVTNDVDLV